MWTTHSCSVIADVQRGLHPFVYKLLLSDAKAEEQAWIWEALCNSGRLGNTSCITSEGDSLAHTVSRASITILSQ